MKHAILILAHKNVGQLCRLVEYFKHDCDVFIHIDKKQTIKPADKEKLLGFNQVKFISDTLCGLKINAEFSLQSASHNSHKINQRQSGSQIREL